MFGWRPLIWYQVEAASGAAHKTPEGVMQASLVRLLPGKTDALGNAVRGLSAAKLTHVASRAGSRVRPPVSQPRLPL